MRDTTSSAAQSFEPQTFSCNEIERRMLYARQLRSECFHRVAHHLLFGWLFYRAGI